MSDNSPRDDFAEYLDKEFRASLLAALAGVAVAAALGLVLAFLMSGKAHAQRVADEHGWIRQAIRSQCEWWENCTYRYSYKYVRRLPPVRVESWRHYADHRHLDRCKPAVKVWSSQAQSEDNAYRKAIEMWAGAVRFQYGEIYLAIENAENVKKLCGPSSVADTVSSKLQEKIGIEYWRCELTATPCRPIRKED